MGKSYLLDYCVAVHQKAEKEKAYRRYVTDCLRMLTESTAKFAGGTHMKTHFSEIVGWDKTDEEPMTPEEEAQTGAQIIQDVKDRLNWLMGGGGEDGEQ